MAEIWEEGRAGLGGKRSVLKPQLYLRLTCFEPIPPPLSGPQFSFLHPLVSSQRYPCLPLLSRPFPSQSLTSCCSFHSECQTQAHYQPRPCSNATSSGKSSRVFQWLLFNGSPCSCPNVCHQQSSCTIPISSKPSQFTN